MTSDTGFLPRFLIAEPPSTIGNRPNSLTKRDDATLANFQERLRAILETPMPMDPETRELTPRVLLLSPTARDLLVGFADAIEKAQAPGGDLEHITGYASKAAEQAARIAGVLTLFRNLDAQEVTPCDMAGGITLGQFYLAEAARLAEAATVSTEIDKAEKLRRWLLETWSHTEVVLGDVVQFGPRDLRDTSTVRPLMVILEHHGWLLPLSRGTVVRGAARKQAWRIVGRNQHVV